MLSLQTASGTRYFADLLELVEDAAGPTAKPAVLVGLLTEVMTRLITARAGFKSELALDQVAKHLGLVIAQQTRDVQTYVLEPLLNPTPTTELEAA